MTTAVQSVWIYRDVQAIRLVAVVTRRPVLVCGQLRWRGFGMRDGAGTYHNECCCTTSVLLCIP